MGDKSGIGWTDATWNAVTGCTKVSAGCDHCYADDLANGRLAEVYGRQLPVIDTPANRADPFSVRLWPERMDQPARWTKPRMIFVNSMSDFFHVDIPHHFRMNMWAIMQEHHRHTYQILTKRPGRAIRWIGDHFVWPVKGHIWIGTSIENRATLFRVDQLMKVNAQVRFLSLEPLLEDLGTLNLTGISWVIVGGESGRVHRPMKLEWVRRIRDQCVAAGVPFFFKQVGGRTPKAGGRDLDGRTWDEFPEIPAPLELGL